MLNINELSVMDVPRDTAIFTKSAAKDINTLYDHWKRNPEMDTPERLAEQVAWMLQHEGNRTVLARIIGRYRRRCNEIEDKDLDNFYAEKLLS